MLSIAAATIVALALLWFWFDSLAQAAPREAVISNTTYTVYLPFIQRNVPTTPTATLSLSPTPSPTPTMVETLSGTPAVPCSDARGCPNMVPDPNQMKGYDIVTTTPLPTTDCAVVEGYAQTGVNVVLRFTLATSNMGPGSLIIGDPTQHPEWFIWSDCHQHYHFKDFASYRLWTQQGYQQWTALKAQNPGVRSSVLLQQHPEIAAQMTAARKFGFCAVDYEHATLSGAPTPDLPRFTSCANQGISVGWADAYTKTIVGQWVEVRDVLPGQYMLEAEINPEHFFTEANYGDNSAAISVSIPASGLPTRTPSPTPTP